MTDREMLSLMRLLSALESWVLGAGKTIPDHLKDQLSDFVDLLEREILKGRG